MATLNLYRSHIPSSKYIFKNGKEANFIQGRYTTADETEIAELDAEVKAGHPFIFVKADEATVDSDQLSPLEHIKQQAIKEYLAAQASATDNSNDMGSTETKPVLQGIVTSKTAGGASLANLSNTK